MSQEELTIKMDEAMKKNDAKEYIRLWDIEFKYHCPIKDVRNSRNHDVFT